MNSFGEEQILPERLEDPLHLRHVERRGDAFPRNVPDGDADAAVRELHEIVIVAPHFERGRGDRVEIDRGRTGTCCGRSRFCISCATSISLYSRSFSSDSLISREFSIATVAWSANAEIASTSSLTNPNDSFFVA